MRLRNGTGRPVPIANVLLIILPIVLILLIVLVLLTIKMLPLIRFPLIMIPLILILFPFVLALQSTRQTHALATLPQPEGHSPPSRRQAFSSACEWQPKPERQDELEKPRGGGGGVSSAADAEQGRWSEDPVARPARRSAPSSLNEEFVTAPEWQPKPARELELEKSRGDRGVLDGEAATAPVDQSVETRRYVRGSKVDEAIRSIKRKKAAEKAGEEAAEKDNKKAGGYLDSDILDETMRVMEREKAGRYVDGNKDEEKPSMM
ncbi:hypothetical protein NpPPO83_00003731 [Neofusicoccum parvum]|uniref:Uncharacterized protein n=1 Tax=Neofusicoccum parvum TaxID=310453 RepID=A0ACB5SBQ8_9PEZI|nr:hypothetical protein NpPPO83_00003731 [Neofusicoccum parvum]